MDIFNSKRVEELERENAYLKRQLCEADSRAVSAENALATYLEIRDSIPEDCVQGTYCRGCTFVKEYCYSATWYHGQVITGYYCGKGKACKNFIQKKVEEK